MNPHTAERTFQQYVRKLDSLLGLVVLIWAQSSSLMPVYVTYEKLKASPKLNVISLSSRSDWKIHSLYSVRNSDPNDATRSSGVL
jgi:hypothetical protein